MEFEIFSILLHHIINEPMSSKIVGIRISKSKPLEGSLFVQ